LYVFWKIFSQLFFSLNRGQGVVSGRLVLLRGCSVSGVVLVHEPCTITGQKLLPSMSRAKL
jgi:hypothetical protein